MAYFLLPGLYDFDHILRKSQGLLFGHQGLLMFVLENTHGLLMFELESPDCLLLLELESPDGLLLLELKNPYDLLLLELDFSQWDKFFSVFLQLFIELPTLLTQV